MADSKFWKIMDVPLNAIWFILSAFFKGGKWFSDWFGRVLNIMFEKLSTFKTSGWVWEEIGVFCRFLAKAVKLLLFVGLLPLVLWYRKGQNSIVARRGFVLLFCTAAVVVWWLFSPLLATGTWYAYQSGPASWYGGKFYFRRTASGEMFLPGPFYTAAHKKLPLGTEVLVVNNKTDQHVVVRINDRGPYVGKRIIDLTYAAARRAGVYKPGTADVTIYTRKPQWKGARKIFMYF